MGEKVLVTGAAGFIGFHLTKRLIERGDQVVGIDNLNDYYDVNLKRARLAQLEGRPGFRFVKMSLEDREGLLGLFKEERFDKVVNLAAQAGVRYSLINPYAYIDANIVGFINILFADFTDVFIDLPLDYIFIFFKRIFRNQKSDHLFFKLNDFVLFKLGYRFKVIFFVAFFILTIKKYKLSFLNICFHRGNFFDNLRIKHK